jgi:hypothetical protein
MRAQPGKSRRTAITFIARIADELQVRADGEVVDYRDVVMHLGDLLRAVVQVPSPSRKPSPPIRMRCERQSGEQKA